MHKSDHHHLMHKWSSHSREWLSWWSSSPSYAPSYAWVIITIPFPGVIISDHFFKRVIIISFSAVTITIYSWEWSSSHCLRVIITISYMRVIITIFCTWVIIIISFIHISEHHHLIHNWMSTCLRENITSFIREHIITLSHESTSFYSYDWISPSYSQDWKLPPYLVQKPILSLLQNRWTIDYYLPIHSWFMHSLAWLH